MAIIGEGGRHYRGPETQAPYSWTCPRCGVKQVTPLEDGCPSCGAGTAAEREASEAEAARVKADAQVQAQASEDWKGQVMGDEHTLYPAARLTLARALAMYAELGTPGRDELPAKVTLAWARHLAAELDQEKDSGG